MLTLEQVLQRVANEKDYLLQQLVTASKYAVQYIMEVNDTLSDPCVKKVGVEYLGRIRNTLQEIDSELRESIFKIMIKGRPEIIYKKPVIKMFVELLGLSYLLGAENLFRTFFRAYALYAFQIVFFKRFVSCDPETMVQAQASLGKRSDLAKVDFDYSTFINKRITHYLEMLKSLEKANSSIEYRLQQIVKIMDYYKNNINSAIKPLADAYYKELNSNTQKVKKKALYKKTIRSYYSNIIANVKRMFKDIYFVERYKSKQVSAELLFCLTSQFADDDNLIRELLSQIIKLTDYVDYDPCTSKWIEEMVKIPVRKDSKNKELKKLLDSKILEFAENCTNPQKVRLRHTNFLIEVRKNIFHLFLIVVVDTTCKEGVSYG